MPVEMSRAEYDAKRARVAELRQQLEAQLKTAEEMGTTPKQLEATHLADPFDPTAHRLREGDLRKLRETANSGAFLGGGDELGSGLAAVISEPFMRADGIKIPFTPVNIPFTGHDGPTIGQIYDKEQTKHEREQTDLNERNPMATLGARVGGGLVGSMAKIGLMAPTAAVLGKIPGGAFAGGPIRNTLAKTLGAGVEGGATGYLTADRNQNREQAAGVGAPLQAALYAAMKGLGSGARGTWNVATHNRYSLGTGDDFVPLNMVGEGMLPSAYRKVIGSSFGGGPVINEQSAKVLNKALGLQENAQTGFDAANKVAKQNFTAAKNEITDSAVVAKNLAEQSGLSKTQAARLAAQQVEEQTNQGFRAQVIDRSLPNNTPPEVRQQIAQLGPVQANNLLDDVWAQHGFADVKQRAFTVKPAELHNAVAQALDNPGQEGLAAGIKSQIDKMFTRHGDALTQPPALAFGANAFGVPVKNAPMPKGEIAIGGDALMQIRNDLRTAASNLAEQGFGATEANALRKAAHAVDAQIERQLDAPNQAAYRAELGAYGHRRTLDKTIQATPNDLFGQFEPKHWLIGAERYSPRRLARGEAPTQPEAEAAMRVTQAAKRELGDSEDAAQLFVKTAKNQIAADKVKEGRALVPPQDEPAVIQAGQVLKQATEHAKTMSARMPAKDPAPWTSNYSTDLLTRPLGMPTTGMASTGTGGAIGAALASPGAQRLLAGDTQTQKTIANWLRNAYDPTYKQPVHDAARGLLREGIRPLEELYTPRRRNKNAS